MSNVFDVSKGLLLSVVGGDVEERGSIGGEILRLLVRKEWISRTFS